MIVFLFGFLVVSILAAGGAVVTDLLGAHSLMAAQHLWLCVVLAVAPFVAAALATWLIDWWRPRRFLGPIGGLALTRFARGVVAGALAVVLYTGALPFLDAAAPGELFTAGAGAIAAVFVLLLSDRVRPGTCLRCAYDLSESAERARCPECGEGTALVVQRG